MGEKSIINNSIVYPEEAIKALEEFKAEGPWSGKISERKEKYCRLHDKFCNIFETEYALEFDDIQLGSPPGSSGSSVTNFSTKTITLRKKLSVTTYLHEFYHAAFNSMSQYNATVWSVNLFKRVFPEQFERLTLNEDNMLVPQ